MSCRFGSAGGIKKYYKVLIGFLAAYCSWALVLSFLVIEEAPNRLLFSFLYAAPMAVELVSPHPSQHDEFCSSKAGGGGCKALSAATLIQFYADEHYEFGRRRWPSTTIKPVFFVGNKACHSADTSLTVNCLTAFEGVGPKGEELFLCHRRCFFPELKGERYEYG